MHISTATALHSIYVSLMKLGSWTKLMGWSSFLFCCNSGILFCMIKAWINSLMFATPSSQLTKWANIEEQFLFFLHFSTLFVQPEYKGTLSFIGNHCHIYIYIGFSSIKYLNCMIFLSDSLMFFLGNDLTDSTLLFYTNKDLFPSIKWQIV